MKLMRLCVLALTCISLTGLEAGVIERLLMKSQKPTPPSVKVLIAHDETGAVLEVKGKYRIFDPNTNEFISTRFIGKRKYIQAINDGIKWGEEFPGVHQLLIMPASGDITTLVDGIEYRGNVYVYDIGGTISIVNQPDVEDFLKSLLATRYRENLAPETLAAIAIATRTNVYYQIANAKNNFWDIDGKLVDYKGYAVTVNNTAIDTAVNATRFMAMSTSSDEPQPFAAQWGNNAGDKASGNVVWSKITVPQAQELATNGDDAGKILGKAFPGASIVLMYDSQKDAAK